MIIQKKILIIFLLTLIPVLAFSNQGHRGGCENELYDELPQNSIICLEAGLRGVDGNKALQGNNEFKYLEIDIRETNNGKLAVYHGGRGGKIFRGKHASVTYCDRNKKIFKDLNIDKSWKSIKVKNLTEVQVQAFFLDGGGNQHIPLLANYMAKIKEYNLKKPLMVEIKDVHTDNARTELIRIVSEYEKSRKDRNNPVDKTVFSDQKVGFLIRKMSKLNNDKNKWCEIALNNNLSIYKTGEHNNICK